MMKKKFKPDMIRAMRQYFLCQEEWQGAPIPEHERIGKTKEQCLEEISAAAKRRHNGIRNFHACAGQFWFDWQDGKTTTHTSCDWQEMREWKGKRSFDDPYCYRGWETKHRKHKQALHDRLEKTGSRYAAGESFE